MSRENISTLYNVEGLLLLSAFLVGFYNAEWWLPLAFYVLLPLAAIIFIISAISLPLKSTASFHRELKRFYYFNLAVLVFLMIFVWWATGGAAV
jgi:hypothetical protein